MHRHKAWERSSCSALANTSFYGGRSGFVVYGHKETTTQQCEELKGPEGGGGNPVGGETELNRAPIALPKSPHHPQGSL